MNYQEKNTHFVDYFLSRLKSALNFSTNKELAEFLGVSEQSLSNWKARGRPDYSLTLTKCVDENINLNYLFTGEGNEINAPNDQTNQQMNCNECPYKELVGRYQEDIARYRDEIAELKEDLRTLRQHDAPSRKRHSA